MTPEPPPPSPRRRRPDPEEAGSRPSSPAPPPSEAPRRESLAQSLSRIPDLVPGELDPLLDPDAPRVNRGAARLPPAAANPSAAKAAPASSAPSKPAPSKPVTAKAAPSKGAPAKPAPATPPTAKPAPAEPSPTAKAPTPERRRPTPAVPVVVAAAVPTAAAVVPTVEAPAPEATPPTPTEQPKRRLRPPSAAALGRPSPDPEPKPDLDQALTAPAVVGRRPPRREPVPRVVPWWRRLAFAGLIVALVAAIPGLTYVGYRIIGDSTEGQYTNKATSPADPGYEAQVVPTPTAVAVQYDAEGLPTSATFLALSGGAGGPGGGAVVFVPLATQPGKVNFGITRLRDVYTALKKDPEAAQRNMVGQIAGLLNVGIDQTIPLDDAAWTQLVAPVAPLAIRYGDAVELPDGTVIPAGDTVLQADQVGPYLAAAAPGGDDRGRLDRQAVVWRAWIDAVAASDDPDVVPGESTVGMGQFVRQLAADAASVHYETLPVEDSPEGEGRLVRNVADVKALVGEYVPSPNPGVPGQRFSVRLLNGVAAGPLPTEISRKIVDLAGSVNIVGNGPSFDTAETSVVFNDPAQESMAELVLAVLGATGEAVLDPKAPDTIDLTVVVGRDILGDLPAATTTTTSATGGP